MQLLDSWAARHLLEMPMANAEGVLIVNQSDSDSSSSPVPGTQPVCLRLWILTEPVPSCRAQSSSNSTCPPLTESLTHTDAPRC
jgi:hypothetical protein